MDGPPNDRPGGFGGTWAVLGSMCMTALFTTPPLLGLTLLGDQGSKDGPIGWPVYLGPLAVGLATGVVGAGVGAASWRSIGRNTDPVVVGLLVSVVSAAAFVCGWGGWWFEYAARFRG